MKKKQTIGFLGAGTMARALIRGLRRGPQFSSLEIFASARSEETARSVAADLGISVLTDNAALARRCEVVVLCVKPQQAAALFGGKSKLGAALKGKLLISICAGIRLEQLAQWAPGAKLVRAMPNTPALVGQGMTALAPGLRVSAKEMKLAESLFTSVGRVRVLDEKHMDAVTGLSGSGPAFACVMIEALADGGVMMGLPRAVALELAAQTMAGAAHMVLESGEHPAALRDSVTTPAGCTIAGLFKMEEGRVRSTLAKTVQEASQVASQLGR